MKRMLICLMTLALLAMGSAALGEESPAGGGFGNLSDMLNIGGTQAAETAAPEADPAPQEGAVGSGLGSLTDQLSFDTGSGEAVQSTQEQESAAGAGGEAAPPAEPEAAAQEPSAENVAQENEVNLSITVNGTDWQDATALKLTAEGENRITWQADGEVVRFFAFVTDLNGDPVVIDADTTEMIVPGGLLKSGEEYCVIVGYQPVGGNMEDSRYSLVRVTCA